MADDKLNHDECTIGLSADETVCIVTIPLHKYAMDEENGNALIYGKVRELQAHIMSMAVAMRKKKAQSGLMRVNGHLPPDLKVN